MEEMNVFNYESPRHSKTDRLAQSKIARLVTVLS